MGWSDQREPPGGEITQYPRTNPETSAVRMAWREKHTGRSGRIGCDPRAHGWFYLCTWCFPAAVVTSAAEHWVVQCLGLYSTGKFGPPSISFLWLHCRKVNLYIKLSHSSLSKNIMCLAQDPPGVCIRGYYKLQGSNVNIRTECPEVLFLQVVNSL